MTGAVLAGRPFTISLMVPLAWARYAVPGSGCIFSNIGGGLEFGFGMAGDGAGTGAGTGEPQLAKLAAMAMMGMIFLSICSHSLFDRWAEVSNRVAKKAERYS
ncbi:hypothetical protein D3C84_844080 [compost metagenome]